MDFDRTVFDRLMLKAGIRTYVELARRAGCSSTYARFIAGGLKPSPKIKLAVAQALGVRVGALWPDERA